MIRHILLLLTILYSSTSCGSYHTTTVVDPKTAATALQHDLAIQGFVTAEELHGGHSGAKLFVATTDSNRYVLRAASPNNLLNHNEIACLQIASANGYGPHVYAINPNRQYIIMEYITPHSISTEDRSSTLYYRALGEVLSKMHYGPAFPDRKNIFNEINTYINQLKQQPSLISLMSRMEIMSRLIQESIAPVSTKAPCHFDLNPNNMIYTGSSFKIIDFEDAGQGDPYFDIATVIQFNCIRNKNEREILDAYFGRSMTKEEKAKLFLMKQAVRIRYSAMLLVKFPNQDGEIDVGSETYNEFVQKSQSQCPDLRRLALHLFKLASTSLDSPEFQQAVDTLKVPPSQK